MAGFAVATLVAFIVFLVLVAGVRPWIQARRTGELGDRRAAACGNPVQRRIDALAAVGALAVGVASPVAALSLNSSTSAGSAPARRRRRWSGCRVVRC